MPDTDYILPAQLAKTKRSATVDNRPAPGVGGRRWDRTRKIDGQIPKKKSVLKGGGEALEVPLMVRRFRSVRSSTPEISLAELHGGLGPQVLAPLGHSAS